MSKRSETMARRANWTRIAFFAASNIRADIAASTLFSLFRNERDRTTRNAVYGVARRLLARGV